MNVEQNLPKQVQLTSGEQILAHTRPTLWNHVHLILLALFVSIIAPIPLFFVTPIVSLLLLLVAVVLWLYTIFLYKTRYHLIVTNKRIIFFKKSLGIRLDDIHLEEVNDVKVDQGFIGRILNYGSVTVIRSKFTVMTSDPFPGIRNPFEVSGSIERAVESVKKE